jgi:hypothetical protein
MREGGMSEWDVSQDLGLESVFPRTFLCLGEAESRRVLADFLKKFPASLGSSQIAGLFPFFLANRKWSGESGYVPDLAALEWSLRLADQAPRLPPQGFERVTTASEPQWFSAQFRFDPAHAVMVSDWPLDEIYRSAGGPHSRRPGKYLIFRSHGRPGVRSLDENEARLIEALSLGVPLGVILDRPGGPEFDAFLFHEWIQSGLLTSIHWSDQELAGAEAPV